MDTPLEQYDLTSKEIISIKDKLREYIRDLYTKLWLENALENEKDVDLDKEKKSSIEYFNYIYEKGEHPY